MKECWLSLDLDPHSSQGSPVVISRWYSVLAGCERALLDWPAIQAEQVEKVAQMEKAAAAFAKQHGISTGKQ